MTTPARTLLGLLFPSWTFFDAVRLTPSLQLRALDRDGVAGPWRDAVTPAPRRWWHVLFNPAGTETLAGQTLVETWARELADDPASARTGGPSLPLILALGEHLRPLGPDDAAWQLRLIVTDAQDDRVEVLYESERLPARVERPS